ncbi:hypothetical protein SDRG_09502 [Saprolegnia diclina VS20]|uniref:DUF7164 domain-containing protein n=1 Tax=Saprolegnia diclina (strain VS20) TaxID=1156394 RepID=T0RSA6_SAPDV|nr:hypothetical protein SDRG_09502 [Saprolegnia diclina VS20]EQC32977.1 hypothetical protein SDRG_09502 [Saprolegnia diclina VS20]|eukprot:XP_008613663.1 hypothetical protein SDRG_09502 [Saprolegnia diclina VS20]
MLACTFRRVLLAGGLACIVACAALITYLDESSYFATSLRKFRTKRETEWLPHHLTNFSRAAVLFLPASNDNARFLSEFRWFHRSWLEMKKHEPALWRTDIVVFSDATVPLLAELGCTDSPRSSNSEPNKCVAVQNYTKLQNENFTYAYADSVNVLAVDLPATANYDWILRTDIDTFLTPAFATWKPDSFAVGRGAYCGPGTCDRLARISRDLNLTEATQHNIGSTWYGPATTLKECAKLSVETMMYLRDREFTDEEKSVAYGVQGWPKWHYGVLTMYSGDIAINHCTRAMGFETRTDMLDFPSSSSESPMEHAHLHTWQNDERSRTWT